MVQKQETGRWGEEAAAQHLIRSGYTIVERNWRCRWGEIDIVARRGEVLAFVEVKARRTRTYGHPLESITPVKARRLRRLAAGWCADRRPDALVLRIDAIAVTRGEAGRAVIDHRENAC